MKIGDTFKDDPILMNKLYQIGDKHGLNKNETNAALRSWFFCLAEMLKQMNTRNIDNLRYKLVIPYFGAIKLHYKTILKDLARDTSNLKPFEKEIKDLYGQVLQRS